MAMRTILVYIMHCMTEFLRPFAQIVISVDLFRRIGEYYTCGGVTRRLFTRSSSNSQAYAGCVFMCNEIDDAEHYTCVPRDN